MEQGGYSVPEKVLINPVVYAMREFQEQMKGQAAQVGFQSEDDAAEWITQTRREDFGKQRRQWTDSDWN